MKIHNKLFLILFSFSLVLVTVLILLIQWSIGKGMIEYVNSKEIEALKPLIVKLETAYKKENNWSSLQGKHRVFDDLIFSTLTDHELSSSSRPQLRRPKAELQGGRPEQRRAPPNHRADNPNRALDFIPPHVPPKDKAGYALLDNKQNLIAGHYRKNVEHSRTMITVNKKVVGWLVIPKRKKITDGYELAFIEQQQNYLWIIALATMFLVTLITLLLSRHIAQPIKLVISGMHKLTQGDYQQSIDLKRKDELGDLSRDFNELAITLNENESTRKRWLANISHELRTPVAILRGELEAMLDGIRPLNKSNIDSANDEVKHLQSLIDDLHQLTSADIGGMHYRKKHHNFTLWLQSEMNKHRSYLAAADISLLVDIPETKIMLFSDNTRLCQLFENLINNSIKYAEASVVRVSLALDNTEMKSSIVIKIEDNGIGVPAVHLPHLFEHLYRVENSRNRKTGGSGLGLSICAHIVAAHQGRIVAERSSLGGLAIIIKLPLS
ncbi:HAMP domain-containing protein [Psychromonas sp. RZ22]|uniref:ATP-binding protein n=1 Tax=Psychromonas algarum TaxID=2555643 RepID=UPI001068A4D8|nr:ATP-binding protein [Psychromonas sp. RZ22]TEW55687.1 HAMP domain-containing protein [Psychromonas sp. RZ22]